MSVHTPDAALIARRTIIDTTTTHKPPMQLPTRHFDLPPLLHGATLALFLTYLGAMGATFAGDRMPIVLAICAISVIGMFVVPALFQLMGPRHVDRPMSLSAFARDGIDCLTGRLSAGQASVQVLIMPVLILAWGIAIAIIVTAVR